MPLTVRNFHTTLSPFFRIFTKSEIDDIKRVRLWDIIINTTNIGPISIQKNVFVWSKGDPCPQPLQLNSSILEPCAPLQRYDYFQVRISHPYLKKSHSNFSSDQENCCFCCSGQRIRLHLHLRGIGIFSNFMRGCRLWRDKMAKSTPTQVKDTSGFDNQNQRDAEQECGKNVRARVAGSRLSQNG